MKVLLNTLCRSRPAPALALLNNLLSLGQLRTFSFGTRLLAAFCIIHLVRWC